MKHLLLGLTLGLLMASTNVWSSEFTHCGPDGGSPPAPPWMCEPQHSVPEPATMLLIAAPLVWLAHKSKTWRA